MLIINKRLAVYCGFFRKVIKNQTKNDTFYLMELFFFLEIRPNLLFFDQPVLSALVLTSINIGHYYENSVTVLLGFLFYSFLAIKISLSFLFKASFNKICSFPSRTRTK